MGRTAETWEHLKERWAFGEQERLSKLADGFVVRDPGGGSYGVVFGGKIAAEFVCLTNFHGLEYARADRTLRRSGGQESVGTTSVTKSVMTSSA